MRNSLLADLLSYDVQLIDENNGKYTFLLVTSSGKIFCPPLFDRSIPVGSLIVAKVLTKLFFDSFNVKTAKVTFVEKVLS